MEKRTKSLNLVFSILTGLIITFGVYRIIFSITTRYNHYTENMVNSTPATTEGVIFDFHTYKGNSVGVEYYVDGKRYTIWKGVSSTLLRSLIIGQKLQVRYCTKDPSLAILDLN